MSEQQNKEAAPWRWAAESEEVQFRAMDAVTASEAPRNVIRGYAAVYNSPSVVMRAGRKRFREVIAPGAFAGCDFSNVVARFNHGYNSTLARTPGTLRLMLDSRGLMYEFDYDADDPEHVSLRAKIKRGDIRTSSFEFYMPEDGETWDTSGEVWTRTITKISHVMDVGPVVNAAYPDTSAVARSIERLEAEHGKETAAAVLAGRKRQVETMLSIYGIGEK